VTVFELDQQLPELVDHSAAPVTVDEVRTRCASDRAAHRGRRLALVAAAASIIARVLARDVSLTRDGERCDHGPR
jgi:ribonuclease HII